jgi:tetratricopeptide (TPR) repeat protein
MSTPQTHTPDGLFEQGLALHQAGMLEEAIAYYDAVLAAEPAHFDALHLTGVACMQKGQGERAVQLMERAIAINPDVAAPYINLAAALNAMTRFPNAVACCNRALAIEPDSAEAHSNRGNALLALGHGEAALADYDRVVALTPASAEGHFNRGNALSRLGRLGEAVASFDAAIALRPDYLEAIVNRGSALDKQRRSIDALASFDAAAVAHPNNAEAHANRAKTLNDLQRSEEALAAADHAIGLAPEDAGAHNNRGVALHHMGRQREAIASFELAVTLQPDYVEAYNNIGIALYDLRRPRDGLRQFDRALSLNPNFAIAHMNRATSLLALGELADGFAEYRWRWQVPGAAPQPNLLCPAWEGESLEGKRILVHSEQGFGDTLQFVRFTPALAGMRAEVTLLVPPALVGLLRSLSGARVTERIDETDAFDLHVPMMCLPRLLGTTLDTIPAATPYLAADPEKAARWAERLASDGEGFRVGLVWAGGSRPDQPAAHALDQRRSLSLAQLAPLADVAGVRFFSLQKDGPASQAANPPAGMALADLTDDLHDFSDTAALIANLDLVITVDTSVAHLAGALGKPVWILSRYAGCWRWLNHREDSPWYPTARLFHQPSPGDWESVVTWVAAALAERA